MTDAELFDIDGPVQQSRLARLMLGMLTGDDAVAALVFDEMARDERGEPVALQAVLIALLRDVLAVSRRAGTTSPQLVRRLRAQVAALEGKNHG